MIPHNTNMPTVAGAVATERSRRADNNRAAFPTATAITEFHSDGATKYWAIAVAQLPPVLKAPVPLAPLEK